MSKVLMSINPEHVSNILFGLKKFEFRKTLPKKPVDSIVIYSTFPVMRVVAEVEVNDILVDTPDNIWSKCHLYSGIDKSFFDRYYYRSSKAVAYSLGNVHILTPTRHLSYYGITTPPQSFVYLPSAAVNP